MKIVLISCTKNKLRRPGKMLPAVLYQGTLFQKRVAYAARLGLPWMVLSAKYGLWPSDAEKEWYDTSFASLSRPARRLWPIRTAHLLIRHLWSQPTNLRPSQVEVEIHGNQDYAHPLDDILRAYGVKVTDPPTNRLAIGQQISWYSRSGFPPDATLDAILAEQSLTEFLRSLGAAGWTYAEVRQFMHNRLDVADATVRGELSAGRKHWVCTLSRDALETLRSRLNGNGRTPLFKTGNKK